MSVRRGISEPPVASLAPAWRLHQGREPVEQIRRIVRTRRGLGVVLHRERPPVEQSHALHDAVVGAGVADLGRAERCLELLAGLALEREPVVLRGDRDPPGACSSTGMLMPRCPNFIL